MGYYTVPQIISYAEVSLYLASKDILKGQLYSPILDKKWAKVISLELASVKWAYNQSATYPGLELSANYLYDLLYKNYQAKNIVNGGGGGIPIIPVNPIVPEDCSGVVTVLASQFEADGKTYFNSDWAGKNLYIFWWNIPNYLLPPAWLPAVGGGFVVQIPTDFDAKGNNSDAVFIVTVGCLNPGSMINPYQTPINTPYFVTGVDNYDLIRTPFLLAAYGNVRFQVSQKDGNGDYQATGIQPTYNEADDPLVYHFTGLGGLDTQIVAF